MSFKALFRYPTEKYILRIITKIPLLDIKCIRKLIGKNVAINMPLIDYEDNYADLYVRIN